MIGHIVGFESQFPPLDTYLREEFVDFLLRECGIKIMTEAILNIPDKLEALEVLSLQA